MRDARLRVCAFTRGVRCDRGGLGPLLDPRVRRALTRLPRWPPLAPPRSSSSRCSSRRWRRPVVAGAMCCRGSRASPTRDSSSARRPASPPGLTRLAQGHGIVSAAARAFAERAKPRAVFRDHDRVLAEPNRRDAVEPGSRTRLRAWCVHVGRNAFLLRYFSAQGRESTAPARRRFAPGTSRRRGLRGSAVRAGRGVLRGATGQVAHARVLPMVRAASRRDAIAGARAASRLLPPRAAPQAWRNPARRSPPRAWARPAGARTAPRPGGSRLEALHGVHPGFGPTITLCTYRPGTRDSITDWCPLEWGRSVIHACHITMGVGTRRGSGSGAGGARAPSAREAERDQRCDEREAHQRVRAQSERLR